MVMPSFSGLLIVTVGNASLNVTLPTLSRDLGASETQLQWVVAIYSLVFAGLPFGRAIGWIGQTREDHRVSWRDALHQLWPQTALGLACLGLVGAMQPAALPWLFVLLAGGPALAVPLAVLMRPAPCTSWRRPRSFRNPRDAASPPTA